MNWAVHFPVRGSLQEDDDERLVRKGLDVGAEKRDGGRLAEGRLDEGDEKRWWEDNEGMYWRRCPKKDDERFLKEGLDEETLTILIKGTVRGV